MIDGTSVRMGTRMKYLGLYLDATWSFGGHFARLAPRVEAVASALNRLLPNFGEPAECVAYMQLPFGRWPFTGRRSGRML